MLSDPNLGDLSINHQSVIYKNCEREHAQKRKLKIELPHITKDRELRVNSKHYIIYKLW